MNPGEVTRVIAKFDREGLYVWHCHILSHEEHDMMRPFYVGTVPADLTKKKNAIAADFALENELELKVIPNPFNDNATIQFKLASEKKVSIRLYDSRGRFVKEVYQGVQSAGLRRVVLDGTHLTNGVYFCEIILNDQMILRKLVLQR
jgi:spore coat protein A